jgi:AraC family transcriptional regulator of adaptative response / DNA-3-methyladenine glycosylase II
MSENRQAAPRALAILRSNEESGKSCGTAQALPATMSAPAATGAPPVPVEEEELRYAALLARDPRFDGQFFVGVTSTGVYCRPSCPSVVPRRDRVRFFATAAAAHREGFRACKRCRPDAAPGSPEWARRDDTVARAMRAIAEGAVDQEGVAGLASALSYSPRQLRRLLVADVGAGPAELARANRAATAKALIEATDIAFSDVAFAAGFGSVRQFNATVGEVFGETPSAMRARAQRGQPTAPSRMSRKGGTDRCPGRPGATKLSLQFRPPLAAEALFSFLAARAVPGVEEGGPCSYCRSLSLAGGPGLLEVRAPAPGESSLQATLWLEDLRDLAAVVKRLRRLLDLDADPAAVAEVLSKGPLLRPWLGALPGLRVPGHTDGGELALRAVLGQQVSVARARLLAGELARRYGEPLPYAHGAVTRLFPPAEALAAISPDRLPLPKKRAEAFVRLAEALASGEVDLSPGADREEASARPALPGIGPWTTALVRMRALSDPDAFPAGDRGLLRALARAGGPESPGQALDLARTWRPYRSYAAQYLWSYAAQYLWSSTLVDKEEGNGKWHACAR